MEKYKIRNFKIFWNKFLKFLLKHFPEKWKEKLSQIYPSYLRSFKNTKMNTILTTPNVAQFSTKKKSVIRRSFIKRQTSDTSSDKEWQRVVQRVTTNDNKWQGVVQREATSDNEWQRMTTSDNEFFFFLE